jgi:hypothetical protein
MTFAPNNRIPREILSNPFAHVIIMLTLGFVIYMDTFSAPASGHS